MSHRHPIIVSSTLLLLVACATAPTAQLGKTEAAYRAAEEAGSAAEPTAAYHLKLAEDGIAKAKRLIDGDRDDKRAAGDLLERAELDAEVAIARAHSGEAKARAKQAWAEVRELEAQRTTPTTAE